MKPKNFPGRKKIRRVRAARDSAFEPGTEQRDMTLRAGGKCRDASGAILPGAVYGKARAKTTSTVRP